MAKSLFFHLVVLLLALHCLGAMQWICSRTADKSSFVKMMTVAEEKTPNGKNTETDETPTTEEYLNEPNKHLHVSYPHFLLFLCNFMAIQKKMVPQFVSDLPTPPPDFV